ncbi:hypothetical protein J2785_000804 [Burkholderia ambifaria]|nr:hypothetical protein [Burkholderia ambifaria]MDR6497661.1 hypothetical protein [Burkholderia ambifaria]
MLFEVRDAQNHVVASNLPADAAGLRDAREPRGAPRTIVIGDTQWRTHTLRDNPSGRWIRVMETLNTRSDLATGIARGIVLPLIVALPVPALLLWYLIGRSLAPLKTLSTLIGARDARSLEPLGIATAPEEVRTLVDAIDRLLARLLQSIVRERAFIAQYFGGTVQFEPGIGGQGLGVVVALPSANAAGSMPRSAPADEHDDRSRAMPGA